MQYAYFFMRCLLLNSIYTLILHLSCQLSLPSLYVIYVKCDWENQPANILSWLLLKINEYRSISCIEYSHTYFSSSFYCYPEFILIIGINSKCNMKISITNMTNNITYKWKKFNVQIALTGPNVQLTH